MVLTLDADPLLTDPESVRHIGGFAAGRRAGATGGAMNRLWAVEAAYSLTGATADHRLRLRSSRVAAFAAVLAARLRLAGAADGARLESALPGVPAKWIDALVQDLRENRGRCLIVAGERQPAAVHAAVLAMNAALGNVGSTVTYHEPRDGMLCDSASLSALVEAMRGGAVSTLVILGGNPVYDAPVDLDFAGALAKTATSIALTHAVDETATAATWHVPRAHYLEAWGDARAVDGTLSVVQPLIAPLFGAKSEIELLGLIATGTDAPGYDSVVETWKGILGETGNTKAWERVLHDGLLASSALPAVVPDVTGRPLDELMRQAAADPGTGLEAVFVPSASVHDGRFANDAWLQELPDPLTKLTWDNPALMSPKTAAAHGVANEDVVSLTSGGRALEIPRLGRSRALPTTRWCSPSGTGGRTPDASGTASASIRYRLRTGVGPRVRERRGPDPDGAHLCPRRDARARQHGGTGSRARDDARGAGAPPRGRARGSTTAPRCSRSRSGMSAINGA